MNYRINPKLLYQKNSCIPKDSLLSDLFFSADIDLKNLDINRAFYTLCMGKDIYELNLTGSLVWEQILISNSLENTIQLLKKIFDIDENTLKNSINSFIENLVLNDVLVTK